jgi:hypothetical protein
MKSCLNLASNAVGFSMLEIVVEEKQGSGSTTRSLQTNRGCGCGSTSPGIKRVEL